MFNKVIVIVGIILSGMITNGQVIVSDPAYPTSSDEVVITFNSLEGNQGLAGYTGDIWAHTGVITSESSGPTDWKYVVAGWNENTDKAKMTSLGNDLWTLSITPDIREYYGVPESEEILQLAFVFRNSDGSKEGKTEDNGNILVDVYPEELGINIVTPVSENLFIQEDESVLIEAISPLADSLFVFVNNELHKKIEGAQIFDTILPVVDPVFWQENTVSIRAKNETDEVDVSFIYKIIAPNTIQELPDGIIEGINYLDEQTVVLCLYAPDKENAFAIGEFNNWEISEHGQMKVNTNQTKFWIEISNLIPSQEYAFQYLVDGSIKIADPYADKILDPWNDSSIPGSTYPDLKPYPTGSTTGIVSVLQTAQQDFSWEIEEFIAAEKEDLVIYELLIRDFTEERNYKSVIQKLDYLESLGINAIELMPFNEFEGNNSWGYNPSFYFAADKYYGTKDMLKSFIDECHKRNIAVIQDIVLNHAYGQCPLVQLYYDKTTNKPSENSPWFNQNSPNTSYSWGYDFDHQSNATKSFVDSVCRYWMQEYKVDGFRFDFTKGFTNTSGDGWDYDPSRIAILKRIANEIWEYKENAYVIIEHLAVNQEEKELADHGFMLWGNINHNYNEATMGWTSNDKSDLSWGSYKKRNWSAPHLIAYMESHDEERLMYKNLAYGNSSNSWHNVTSTGIALQRIELAAAFYFTIPGPKMIWQFGEMGYDYSINWPSHTENDRLTPKPPRWDYLDSWQRKRLTEAFSLLINLKTKYEVFSTNDFTLDVDDAFKTINLNHEEMNVTIIGNFDVDPIEGTGTFQHSGYWHDYIAGDSVNITNTLTPFTLMPGEYRIYTDKNISDGHVGLKESGTIEQIEIYPNPASEKIRIDLPSDENIYSLKVYNTSGQLMIEKPIENARLNISQLSTGLYSALINGGGKQYRSRFIKN